MVDKSVTSQLALSGMNAKLKMQLDLTMPFSTKSQWALVVAKQPDEDSENEDGAGNRIGAVIYCFVKNSNPDCSESMFLAKLKQAGKTFYDGERPFYTHFASSVLYPESENSSPLLWIKACTYTNGDGDCGISTFLFAYDQTSDNFRIVFFNVTGRNQNQETRFIEHGLLAGHVIAVYPTGEAPYRYHVEVYKRGAIGDYEQILKYRGKTGYNDGNPLAVIDSQMLETLRRLGLWKTTDALPVPPKMPAACTRLVMRKNVEWCLP